MRGRSPSRGSGRSGTRGAVRAPREGSAGAAWLLLLAAALAACAQAPPLRDERCVSPYAELRAWGWRRPRTVERIDAADPGQPPLRVAVEHVPARLGPADRLLVLVNGVFSTRHTWRLLVGPLAEQHDLLLLDPPGCGGSDQPDPALAGPEAYAPRWLARHVLRAVDAWTRRHGDRRRVVFVGHSLGGAVVLRALADADLARAFPDLRARVAALVLLDAPDVVVESIPASLEDAARLTDLEVTLARFVGILDAEVEHEIWLTFYDRERNALLQDAEYLKAILACDSSRHAGQAMLRRYNPTTPGGDLDRAAGARLRADLARVHVPVLVLWGEGDETLPLSHGRRLAKALPDARLQVVARARHAPHVERAPECARAILEFLAERRAHAAPSRAPRPARAQAPPSAPPPAARGASALPPPVVRPVP